MNTAWIFFTNLILKLPKQEIRTRGLTNDPMKRIMNNEDIPTPKTLSDLRGASSNGTGDRSQTPRNEDRTGYYRPWNYRVGNDNFLKYKSKIRVNPVKLTLDHEFRVWYEQFSDFVHRFEFAKALDFENPVYLKPEQEEARRVARLTLTEWLDDEHKKIIFAQPDPTKCIIRIKQYREPHDLHTDNLLSKILEYGYYPKQMKLTMWLEEFEKMSRQLQSFCSDWNEKRKVSTFIKHMKIPFPNFKVGKLQRIRSPR